MADDQDLSTLFKQQRLAPTKEPLTKREKMVLNASYDDLEKQARVMSFSIEEFRARIGGAETWLQLFYAHLYFDHVITKMLLDALKHPEEIKAKSLGFAQKIDLLLALGLLPANMEGAIRKLNALRNSIAHELDFKIAPKHELDFANCVPPDLRDLIKTQKPNADRSAKFSDLLYVLLAKTEDIRQQNTLHRLLVEKGYAQRKLLYAKGMKGYNKKQNKSSTPLQS